MKTLRCRRCKKVFEFTTVGQLCPNCMAAEEERFQKVRKFIKDNPGLSVTDVSEKTGVTPSKILSYIKEERLEVVDGVSFLKCKNCSASINTGMFCDNCKKAMTPKNEVKHDFTQSYVESNSKGVTGTAGAMKNHKDI